MEIYQTEFFLMM